MDNNINETEWSGHNNAKDLLRSRIWAQLTKRHVAIGETIGHIPNFLGAEQAADQLAQSPLWQKAKVIKCNPDTAQIPVRLRALRDGKRLYMAVPRLTQERCFVDLTASNLASRGIDPASAAPHVEALKFGNLVTFEEMQPIDLVVTGCVAVSKYGGRTGKGAGFADLELGILRQLSLVRPDTPIVTTIHPLQIVDHTQLPMLVHDWSLTLIATPDEVIQTVFSGPQPEGLNWEQIRPEQLKTIPILRRLKQFRSSGRA